MICLGWEVNPMPETFRRGKIEDFIRRLQVRKDILKKQLEQQEFQDEQQYIKGQIYAVDTIFQELEAEFRTRGPYGPMMKGCRMREMVTDR